MNTPKQLSHQPAGQQSGQQSGALPPKISIVVPNYNGEKTIGTTLQSLIDQDYPALEIIVVDGGSTDQSISIIQSFEASLHWWISEPDNGQSSAINKGFAQCSGDVVNWLCSDDILTPGALHTVGKHFANDPQLDVLVGACHNIDQQQSSNSYIRTPSQKQIDLMPAVSSAIAQPSCFYRHTLLKRPSPIDESYHYTMDFELWNYFKSQQAKWVCIDTILSHAIQDGNNKSSTGGEKITYELERVYNTYVNERIPLTYWHRKLRYPLEQFLARHPAKLWMYLIGPLWMAITLLLSPFYGFNRALGMRWKCWV